MKQTAVKMIGMIGIAVLAGVFVAQTPALAQDVSEQEIAGGRALEGSWTVQVTIRNCQTGAAIRTFPRLNTFMQGGTMQETAAAGTSAAPALRSPGHGVWEHFSDQNYYYALQFLRLNADGSPAGSVRERRYLTVHILGNSYEATGTGEVFDAAGNLLITTCATETGARFR